MDPKTGNPYATLIATFKGTLKRTPLFWGTWTGYKICKGTLGGVFIGALPSHKALQILRSTKHPV